MHLPQLFYFQYFCLIDIAFALLYIVSDRCFFFFLHSKPNQGLCLWLNVVRETVTGLIVSKVFSADSSNSVLIFSVISFKSFLVRSWPIVSSSITTKNDKMRLWILINTHTRLSNY